MSTPTREELIRDVRMNRPHVVILGAGASRAAFPEGDPSGRRLPVMDDLIDILGLDEELESLGIDHHGQNFEEIYAELHASADHGKALDRIEVRIREYFAALMLPRHPTLYDHLVLSLRPKDIIATFNWDPFVYLACARNYQRASLPNVVYLHGSVAVGYCLKDRRKGAVGAPCSACGEAFLPSKLLFPIRQKGYADESAIQAEWRGLQAGLESAYMLTIFGYSAPQSDAEAIELMRQAWGTPEKRNLEEVEIVDIKSEDQLRDTWAPFIHTHHYRTAANFYDSWIAQQPRRSCEAMWRQTMEIEYLDPYPVPRKLGFPELWEWYRTLVEAEGAPE